MRTFIILFVICFTTKRSDSFVRERVPTNENTNNNNNKNNNNEGSIVRKAENIDATKIEDNDKTNKGTESFVRTASPLDPTNVETSPDTGTFWHITDIHLDRFYNLNSRNPSAICPSSNGVAPSDPGPFGDYSCDSPFKLVNSSIYAMREIKSDPDFIIWSGDNTLHTNNENAFLNETLVLEAIKTVTGLIMDAFPHSVVYPALGNHDFHPKSQMPADCSKTYCPLLEGIADLWDPWLEVESIVFRDSGYYTKVNKKHPQLQIIVLNTNLWYSNNKLINNTIEKDPGGQFKFLESILERAADDRVKYYIIGHIPPGYFELADDKYWLYQNYNNRYIRLIRKYSHVIAGQFFGHHHKDSFRVFEHNGRSVSTAFITPGVSPRMTDFAGVKNSANNPAIRLFQFDVNTLELKDYMQYYLDLDKANSDEEADWKLEYRATEAYDLQNIGDAQMGDLFKRIKYANLSCEACEDYDLVQKFSLYNSVSYNDETCDEICRNKHACAIGALQQKGYDACVFSGAQTFDFNRFWVLLTILVLFVTNWNC